MNPPMRAPLGAALALLLALASLAGPIAPAAVLLAVLAVVALVAAGWPELLELPSAPGTRIVVGIAGAASALLGMMSPGRLSSLEAIATVCALSVFAAFVHQMLRRERTELTASLTSTVAGAMLTGLSGCWVRAQQDATEHGGAVSIVTAGALGLAAALLVLEPPLRRRFAVPLAVLGAAATTAAVTTAIPVAGLPLLPAVLMGGGIGVAAGSTQSLLRSVLVAREPLPSLAVAATPVATVGVIVLLGMRLAADIAG